MRIKLEFISDSEIKLRSGYNSLIQGLIYDLLDYVDAKKLHDEGFKFEKREFRLFSFSEILERGYVNKSEHVITFDNKISFLISSPVEWILKQIALNSIVGDDFKLGGNSLRINAVSVLKSFEEFIAKGSVVVKALTPIEVHSTFITANGARKTYFYTPFENEFSELINKNARKKWKAYFGCECSYELSIKPLFKDKKYETIRYFIKKDKKTIIKGWKGLYMLNAKPEFLRFILDAGLGSRNSQGFGLVEIVR
ncbi:CRISPR-associated protein Cas6 [Thermodesulfobium narugense DSM 14796]|uniref:CRISPR-associated endoribonuclease n=1 Tax=Thermodesulfobium narugense DSM 14796 TaxID=747365 RepID=M1E4R5_9BACT|nr:CRISPR-associated endoribonuclease Cas6 [Thermodesulfobium narugense]AEE14447.1 CRISPR-associated protein Cas6 [Thermodesulfobium narugense DSM 14796]